MNQCGYRLLLGIRMTKCRVLVPVLGTKKYFKSIAALGRALTTPRDVCRHLVYRGHVDAGG